MAVAECEVEELMKPASPNDNLPESASDDFNEYLEDFRLLLSRLFNSEGLVEGLEQGWGAPAEFLDPILKTNPFRVYLAEEYGGRGAHIKHGLSLLEACSYQSLPLSLMVGINGALFLQPVGIYAEESARKEIFSDFLANQRMGGMMITEPGHGSDALKMKTSFSKLENGDKYHLQGLKHWAGLTGKADYWLLAARESKGQGRLGKDISFFIHPSRNKGLEVVEYYKNPGLRLITYGRNQIDCEVDSNYRLVPKTSGIKMLTDILHRSRLQFPGMGVGYIRRLLETGIEHCSQREVGGKNLSDYKQVKSRIFALQSNFTVCSAMCAYTSQRAGCDKDLTGATVEANSIKALVTDYMQESAQSLMQLLGSTGYHISSLASRSIMDSRPFQIFEGSNDILYQQITESVIKSMNKMKTANVYQFLKDYELTSRAADYFKDCLSFELNPNLGQEKLVQLGRIFARVVSLQFTIDLGNAGFNKGMVANASDNLRAEVVSLLCHFNEDKSGRGVEEEDFSNSNWQACVA